MNQDNTNKGNTALHVAVMCQHVEIVRIMLQCPRFTDKNAKNSRNLTAEMMANVGWSKKLKAIKKLFNQLFLVKSWWWNDILWMYPLSSESISFSFQKKTVSRVAEWQLSKTVSKETYSFWFVPEIISVRCYWCLAVLARTNQRVVEEMVQLMWKKPCYQR